MCRHIPNYRSRKGEQYLLLFSGKYAANWERPKGVTCAASPNGGANWLIMYKSDETLSTDEKIDKLRAELTVEITGLRKQIADLTRTVVDELVETKLRNTACSIIMFFLGIQPAQKPPKSRRFADSDNQELLVKMIDACDIDRNPRKLGTNLDNLINDRNTCIHPQTTSELCVDVVKCLEYIKQYPSLRTFEYETFVLEHYADFMKFAPTTLIP